MISSGIKKLFLKITLFMLLGATTIFASMLKKNSEDNGKTEDVYLDKCGNFPDEQRYLEEKQEEFRGLWIAFMDLQVKGEFTEEKFKENYIKILDKAKKMKINNVFVHIRPFSDALYPSKIFPWSHILTGKQGQSPGFDPLRFMLDETHKNGIKFHAWINPMRIQNKENPKYLSDSNPNVKFKNENSEKFSKYVVNDNGYVYYDPQHKEIRDMIVDGIKEVIQDYSVDGISFDDYFYPADNLLVDSKDYKSGSDSFDEQVISFRKNQINLLISETYKAIKEIKKDVVFGICPQGNFKNAEKAGVDIEYLCDKGCVDYLCPEIYTNSENPILPFEQASESWRRKASNKNVKLYVGLGLYKAGSDFYDKGTWLRADDIIKNQIIYIRNLKFDGFVIYSSAFLEHGQTKKEVENILKIIN